MNRRIFSFAGVFFLLAVAACVAQEAPSTPATTIPAGTRTDVDCSGFIAPGGLSQEIYIVNGADNDLHAPQRQYATGDFVFLSSHGNIAEGAEYSLVRSADALFQTQWYSGEGASVRSLGRPYEDLGRAKVIRVTPDGAVARVTFACGPVTAGDLALPYQPRAIPEYQPATPFDRFAQPNGKKLGAITAARNNSGVVGTRSVVYINLGQSDGAKPGDRFRIFHVNRERGGLYAYSNTPRESLGELVVLSTQERSSVGIVVNCVREISLADGVELE